MAIGSTTTVKVQHSGPEGTNDAHLAFDQDVEIKGVNGVSPDDPKADFTVENDGKGGVTISDMNFPTPGDTKLRVKGKQAEIAKLKPGKSYWTIDDEEVGKRF